LIAILTFIAAAAGAPTAVPVGPVTLPTAPPGSVTFQNSWGSQHPLAMYVVQILFLVVVVGLVALMSIQTTKTEGLSGSIGGRMESAYRGRLGIEQQLARLTTGFAVAFMFLAILDFLITR
jgi:protein translocase SecG subunit